MEPCGYREQVGVEGMAACHNPRVHSPGLVPLEVCQHCLLRKAPTYETATAVMLVKQQKAQGPYRPAPKSCGGCGTVKRRQAATQFVWPYFAGAASGDELRFSIRSVEQFFDGETKITIVGDRPSWFRGHVIAQPRIPMTKHWGFRDMLAKMQTMAWHPEIDSEFVWMMDDVYFLKQTSWDELETPRAYPWVDAGKANAWQRIKQASMAALRAKGLPNHDYATHAPHTVERLKLRTLFDDFELTTKTLTWEILYGNRYRGRPFSTRPWFVRIMRRMNGTELRAALQQATVCNHLAELWTPEMRQYLSELLPTPATGEVEDSGFRPEFRRVGRPARRPVKRRHPSTWRVNQPQPIE